MVTFRWFGQACFEISDGKTIVTDPHDGDSVGLKPPDTEGDIVTVSHDHYDHASGKDMVSKPDSILVEGARETEKASEIGLQAFKTYHDKVGGDARGENTIFKFELDGLNICHLGDLGHKLELETVQKLRPVDVLLIPVGGKFTIDGREAAEITEELEPWVAIPMHYDIEGLEVPISSAKEFLGHLQGEYGILRKEELELDDLPEERIVCVLDCLA